MSFITIQYTILQYPNFASFPPEGVLNALYIDETNYKGYLWNSDGPNYEFLTAVDPNAITSADQANELEAGIMKIATQAETNAGLNDTKAVSPKKLANFSGLGALTPFTPEKTAVMGSSSGAWVVRAIGAPYANRIIQVRTEKPNNQVAAVGVRRFGSVFDLSFYHGRGNALFEVLVNGAGQIEIQSNRNNIDFWIVGTK